MSPATQRAAVCVQGLGFVGAAMAVAVASARNVQGDPLYDVTGVDLANEQGEHRIAAINAGRFPFHTTDTALPNAARQAQQAGNLCATADPTAFKDANIVIVDIHLDVDTASDPPTVDFMPIRSAVRTIAERISTHTLTIIETTVPPGTCERIVAPEMKRVFDGRGLDPSHLLLAHSYERVMPGKNYLESITNFWRVYAGATEAAANACECFLRSVINTDDFPLTRLAGTTASETAKLMENSYRATNIAFVEEWSRFAEQTGVDLFSIIEAIRVRPTHNNLRQPGFGVGGYCLTKDPLFAAVAARELFELEDVHFPFCEAAVATNRNMPLATINAVEKALGGTLRGKKILLMGVAYRQDVADTRFSPSETFYKEARARGAEVVAHDPLVLTWSETGVDTAQTLPGPDGFDSVVLAVAHHQYRELDFVSWLGDARTAVVDGNAVLDRSTIDVLRRKGHTVVAVGRGDTYP